MSEHRDVTPQISTEPAPLPQSVEPDVRLAWHEPVLSDYGALRDLTEFKGIGGINDGAGGPNYQS
jgi:hypothetical protein